MKTDSDLLYHDFQGWPVYRMNIREILENLVEQGFVEKSYTTGMDRYIVMADNPILDKYPDILEDDGMGYSPNTKYITDVNCVANDLHIWIDCFDSKIKEENEQNERLANVSTGMD